MITTAVIAEFNPLHLGHEYIINKARELTNADCMVIVMSGNFTQRGDICLCDKWTRTKAALNCGCDIVIELPFIFATSNAGDFARSSVSILNSLGFVDYLVFGSESGDIALLSSTADVLTEEPDEYKDELLRNISLGMSYPLAREKAYAKYTFNKEGYLSETEIKNSNNILALEYLSALSVSKSVIRPITIKRIGAAYNDTSLTETNVFSSAGAIRSSLSLKSANSKDIAYMDSIIKRTLPYGSYSAFSSSFNNYIPLCNDDLVPYIAYSVMDKHDEADSYCDCSEALKNRINNFLKTEGCTFFNKKYEDIILALKTKDITATHISRALLHISIGVKKADFICLSSKMYNKNQYIRLLGLSQAGINTLNKNKKAVDTIIINSLGKSYSALSDTAKSMLSYDIKATNLYSTIVYAKSGYSVKDDYRQNIIITQV